MKIKVKTFQCKNRLDLEELMNTWFNNNSNIKIIDIKIVATNDFCVVILYKE